MGIPNAVANPIVNDPFAAPTRYYDFSGASPQLLDSRQSAGYLPGNRAQVRSVAEQDTIPLDLVNAIRIATWGKDECSPSEEIPVDDRRDVGHWCRRFRKSCAGSATSHFAIWLRQCSRAAAA
jgi:hypothetical protein